MSDRMDKDAMEKFYSYMKAYYPPAGYPMRNPYYSVQAEEKEKKNAPEAYTQMYGYPPYTPYQMPPMGYPQSFGDHEQDKREEDKSKHEMPNPYASYYPYSHYPYYNPYAYPPYYYGQRDYASKAAPSPHAPPPMSAPTQSMFSPPPAEPAPLKILSKPLEKAVKEEIVISSDSEQANEVPAPPPVTAPPVIPKPNPPPSKVQPMEQQKPSQKKQPFMVNLEDDAERDPFLIRKKHKIGKEEKDNGKTRTSKALKHFAVLEKEKQPNTRYAGMPSEAYEEMMKEQTRIRLELFYERERLRKEQERKDKDTEKDKEKEVLKDKGDRLDEKKASSDDKSEKQKKEKTSLATPTPIYRITAPTSVPILADDKDGKRERIKDDHPLKELRYNQSHGRIRLGGYFQSNIPTLMRHEDLAARRVELQKRLREREVSAVTF